VPEQAMKDFTKDGQSYVFEGHWPGATGTMLRFSGRCAICDKRVEFEVKSFGRAEATPLRRCARHKVPGAAVGSKAEAIAIATHGWRVVTGSALHTMRKAGLAWGATVTTIPPGGAASAVVASEKPLLGAAYLMVDRAVKRGGPISVQDAVEDAEIGYDYACVLAGRMVTRGYLAKTRHGRYEATEKGRRAVGASSAPGPLIPMDLTGLDDDPVMGLFD
jgi:hypothetical protein